MVKKVEIARALGVSPSAVSKYVRRGMPATSIVAARAWRDANLDPVRRVAQQWGLNAKRSGKGPPPAALVAHANELGRLARDNYERHEPALRRALAAVRPLPDSIRNLVRLDEHVWDLLLGYGDLPVEGLGDISMDYFDTYHPELLEEQWRCVSEAPAKGLTR